MLDEGAGVGALAFDGRILGDVNCRRKWALCCLCALLHPVFDGALDSFALGRCLQVFIVQLLQQVIDALSGEGRNFPVLEELVLNCHVEGILGVGEAVRKDGAARVPFEVISQITPCALRSCGAEAIYSHIRP
jgi:hypothetical protein